MNRNECEIKRELVVEEIKKYLKENTQYYHLYLENLQTFEYEKLYEDWEWDKIKTKKNFKELLRKLLEEKEINITFLYPETYRNIEKAKNHFESSLEKIFKNYEILVNSKKYFDLNILKQEKLDDGMFYIILLPLPDNPLSVFHTEIYGLYLGDFATAYLDKKNMKNIKFLCDTALHEFLHTLLPHCSEPECVMVYDANIYSDHLDSICGERCRFILDLYEKAKIKNDEIVFDLDRKDEKFKKRCDEDFEKHIKKTLDIIKNEIKKSKYLYSPDNNTYFYLSFSDEELNEGFRLEILDLNKIKFGYEDIGYIAQIDKYNINFKKYGKGKFVIF